MFRVTLLSGGATALCYDGGWFWYINLVELCWLCAHHMFWKVNHVPFVLWISSNVMGWRKLNLRHIKNAEKRGSLVVSIPRAQVYVPVAEGLTLFLPVPGIISLQPVKAPDHGHDQAPDHPVVKSHCVSFPLSHFTGGLVQLLNMLSERISRVALPPSWVLMDPRYQSW